ncbi:MAG: glycerol-3-phosphate dehydrogenase C-terminal domain-containing protein [Anaerolineae bacterium]
MTPLRGGEMQRFKTYLERELAANSRRLDHANLKQLICNYGSDYADVLEYLPLSLPGRTPVEEKEAVLRAQIYHAVYKEMALKLGDIVFRRTELGTAEQPDAATLNYCARTMGEILNWGDDRIRREIDEVNAHFAWKR